jgi:hypothetical protein
MSRPSVRCFSISVDGYGAGPNQDLDNPIGVGGTALHEWMFGTRTFRKMVGKDGGAPEIDDDFCRTRLRKCRSVDHRPKHCLDPSEDRGLLMLGRDGGATIRRTTLPFLCSRITHEHHSK